MSDVQVRRDGSGVVRIVLDRPERKNAMLPTMWADLESACREIEERDEDRVVVMTGTGGEFCSGADVKARFDPDRGPSTHEELMSAVRGCVLALHGLSRPTIAAVDGVAVGGGCNLALACDVVIATERARFSQIFIHRGLAVDTGGSWLLPRLVGLGVATRLVLLGEMLDARAALEIGLVARVVPPSELDGTVEELAGRFLALPSPTLAASKRLLHDAGDMTLAEALNAESAAQVALVRDPRSREAMRAFVRRGSPAADAARS